LNEAMAHISRVFDVNDGRRHELGFFRFLHSDKVDCRCACNDVYFSVTGLVDLLLAI
jgi:hypothetical protein